MAKKLLKYKLNDNGTIPDYIEDGGYYLTTDKTMVGLSVDNPVSNGLGELVTYQNVLDYFNTYQSDYTDLDGKTITVEDNATHFYNKKGE